jgi:hypothetical protein
MNAVMLDLVAIIAISGLVAFLVADTGVRAFAFFGTLWALVSISAIGWIIFVVAHFIHKFW